MNATRSEKSSVLSGLFVVGAALLLSSQASAQPTPLTDKLVGDVGGAAYLTQSVIRSRDKDTAVLPYGYFDYGRFFARVDTLGLKTLKLGNGYLELAGRISQEGWKADTAALAGLGDRKTPIPLGIGTFQETPYGGFFLNAFVDANQSHGALLEASYAAQFKLGQWTFYPQLGLEYRNAKYANYFYGVSAAESAASGYAAYKPGASTMPVMGLALDVPLGEPWVLSLQLRRKWLDSALTNSPLVSRKTQDSGFVALSYRFK
ncbi:outer membrane protein [Polaromonas sp. OV174]|uniref:MipA/OmpV family protein n=1 Tax=Polaromonas sp. OV174 TaxID=1855300 RepID=UPI0008EED923|nr:MipA/OmpV family protein [Polaromonas sp. OV174]SFC34566.1 outer membrane protein [Polaromonas sp. OV174]